MRTTRCLPLLFFLFALASCGPERSMNSFEFEPHLDKPFGVVALYGVGFEGYSDPAAPSNVMLLGWMQGALTRNSNMTKLVCLGDVSVEISSKDGERHRVPLKWMSEEPPAVFDGRIFIRLFNVEEGLIYWDRDPHSRWHYTREDDAAAARGD